MASIRLENDYLSQKLKDELEKIEQEEQEGRSIRPISSGNGWMFKHFLLKKSPLKNELLENCLQKKSVLLCFVILIFISSKGTVVEKSQWNPNVIM